MSDMPRPRKPHLQKQTTRHGRVVWYFRRGHGKRIRMPGDYGSDEFNAAYEAALSGQTPRARRPANSASLTWLIEQYRQSADWSRLSATTHKQRNAIFDALVKGKGERAFSTISRKTIQNSIDARRETPFAAANFLKAMRGLFRWAFKAEHVEADPTEGLSGGVPHTDGFHDWTEEEIARFEDHWAVGTKQRLALAILLYTGLRRGDAANLGRQHMKQVEIEEEAGVKRMIWVFRVRPEKTPKVLVEIPIHAALQTVLDATPLGNLTFIATEGGKPYNKFSFGNWFREQCDAAGCPGSAHGLRKAGARRLAELGASERELNAIFGWADGSKTSSIYTKNADRARLARSAMRRMAG